MKKGEFLNALRQRLSALPAAELERSINYYSEILDDRIEEGMSEEEAVASLEDVETIAQKIISEIPIATLVKAKAAEQGGLKAWHILLIVLGFPVWFPLILTFFILLITFYIVIWALIISAFAVVFALGVSGVACLAVAPWRFNQGVPIGLFYIGIGLACIGLCLFTFFLAIAISRALIKLTVLVGKKSRRIFIRRRR